MKRTSKEDCAKTSSAMFEMMFEESLIFAQFFSVMDDICFGAREAHIFYGYAGKRFIKIQ